MEHSGGPLQIQEFISKYKNFAILGHEEPDGDCLSSQLVLASYLNRHGKEARCYSPGPFLRPEIADIEDSFSTGELDSPEAVFVLDCSTLDRIGRYQNEIDDLPTAVIDHHAAGVPFGDARYIDPEAPSVTFLIYKLMEFTGENPSKKEAELLFFGLCTDTGFFRHLNSGTEEVFAAAAGLVAAGASPKDSFSKMFGNRSFKSRKLLAKLLERTERRCGGRVLVSWESVDELDEFGKLHRDSDALYQLLQTVQGSDIVVLVRQEDENSCSVGLRSTGAVDVGKIAKEFGGGGHHGASGYDRAGNVTEIVEEITGYLEDALQ